MSTHTVPSYAYFVQQKDNPVGPIKIGHSKAPQDRLWVLRTGSPVELVLLGFIPEAQVSEAQLHEALKDIRLHGEWFQATDYLLDFIAECTTKPTAPARKPTNFNSSGAAVPKQDVSRYEPRRRRREGLSGRPPAEWIPPWRK